MTNSLEIADQGKIVAENIGILRRVRGLNYKELAERLDLAGRTIPTLGLRRIESLQRRVDVDDLAAFAVVFEITMPELLTPIRLTHD